MDDITCGIDFGTSNTTIAIARKEQEAITLVPVEEEHTTIPSTLFFAQEHSTVLFGRQGKL